MTISSRSARTVAATVLAAGVGAAALAGAAPAAAATTSCAPFHGSWCVSVTAIARGSYLAQRTGPGYQYGMYRAPKMHNGDKLSPDCWTTGAGDIDGHGDHYWFFAWQWDPANGTFDGGYVNDWYVTTGSPTTWKKKVEHC